MNFVLGLPWTQQGMDFVFFVVDKYLKIPLFMSYMKTSNAMNIEMIFF